MSTSDEIHVTDVAPGENPLQRGSRRKQNNRENRRSERSESSGLSRADGIVNLSITENPPLDDSASYLGEFSPFVDETENDSNPQVPVAAAQQMLEQHRQEILLEMQAQFNRELNERITAESQRIELEYQQRLQQAQQQAPQQVPPQAQPQARPQAQPANAIPPVLDELDDAVRDLRAPAGSVPPPHLRCVTILNTPRGPEQCRKRRTPHVRNSQHCSIHVWLMHNGAANDQAKQARQAAFFLKSQLKRTEKLENKRAGINKFVRAATQRKQEVERVAAENNRAGDAYVAIQQMLAE